MTPEITEHAGGTVTIGQASDGWGWNTVTVILAIILYVLPMYGVVVGFVGF